MRTVNGSSTLLIYQEILL